MAQWKLFAVQFNELLTLLELPLQLRGDLPVTEPASDPATGLPADGPCRQVPMSDLPGLPPRAIPVLVRNGPATPCPATPHTQS